MTSSLPWNTFPECPKFDLSKANESGIIELSSGVKLWHAIFGIPLSQSLKNSVPPVLFLHGGINHSGYYANQIEYFQLSRTVIVFDNRGHGRSPLRDNEFLYDDLGDDIIGLLDYYNIPKAALVGWSDGAVMAWSVLARYPERVDRLWAYGAIDDFRKTGEGVGDIPMVQEYFTRLPKEWKAMNPEKDYDAFFGKYLGMWMKDPVWTAETFKNVPIRGVDEDAPIVWVVSCDYDDWMPKETHQRFHSYIKNSSFLQIPGAGHLAFIQTPQLYNSLVEAFLADK
jgi:pimeloyl-ACP methyl ester carboxylesterase